MSWLEKWNTNYELKFKIWIGLALLNMLNVIFSAANGLEGNAGFALFWAVWCSIGAVYYYFKSNKKTDAD